MKFFEGKLDDSEWGNKFNWVDDRNVLLGYDAEGS